MPVLLQKIGSPTIALFLALILNGCYFQRSQLPPPKPFPSFKGKMALAGFRPALTEDQAAGIVRSPISGAVFMAGPVSDTVVFFMNDILLSQLTKTDGYDMVPPDLVRGALSRILSENNYGFENIDVIRRIGNALDAHGVLVGYLYRWQERDGTDYSAKQPASVAFDLYLIESETGDILWKGSFDKTQKSLMENILDFSFFFKGKGKWMTARQLAELGLSEMLNQKKPGKDQ